MAPPVFISYARTASAAHAQALAARLGDLAFLDTSAIDDGDNFPQRLIDGVLDARIVVLFATRTYSERRFCRVEMRLALAGGDTKASHLVLALGDGCQSVLDAMPAAIALQSWPAAPEAEAQAERLEALVRRRLDACPRTIRHQFPAEEAGKLAKTILEESGVPAPQSLHGVVCASRQEWPRRASAPGSWAARTSCATCIGFSWKRMAAQRN